MANLLVTSNWRDRIRGTRDLEPKTPGFIGKMNKKQKEDKKKRDAAKTPMNEDAMYS